MNRLNFDNLKNLDIPDVWIENALSVPDTHKHKAPLFLNFSRVVATVASLAVVCATSFSVFLFMKDNRNIPVSNHTSTVDTTEEIGFSTTTYNTDGTYGSKVENYFTYSQISEITQESSEEATKKTSDGNATEFNTDPTETQMANGSLPPRETEPQEYPASSETDATTVPTTQQQTTVPTTQPRTTVPQTQIPTTQPLIVPSSSTQEPDTSGWNDIQSYGICYGNFSKTLLAGNGMVYCRLYDDSGKLVGDSNLYSSQHFAHYIIDAGDKIYVQYFVLDVGLELSRGKYSFYFYNEKGVDVYQGSIYL